MMIDCTSRAAALGAAALTLAILGGCATPGAEAPAPQTEPPAAAAPAPAASPLDAPGRRTEDRVHDARRKAAETLAFFAVKDGAKVFELEAGGGYWTEILSFAAGPTGAVVMQNPAGFIPFVKDDLAARFTPGRLANVRQSLSVFDKLDAPAASMDVVTWVQGPHELFYKPEDGSNLGDPVAAYGEIFRILKPGGAFAVVDHSALPGAPAQTGHDLHRIDPALVIAAAEKAGFKLEARGDFLANPADPRTASAFDPAIRGKTDQFAMRFRKPAG